MLSVFDIHKAVAGLRVMPRVPLALFTQELSTEHPSNPGRASVECSRHKRREEFNCGKKQSSPDSETKASRLLKISGEKETGLGEACAMLTW